MAAVAGDKTFMIAEAELRRIVLETSVAYHGALAAGMSVQGAEAERALVMGRELAAMDLRPMRFLG